MKAILGITDGDDGGAAIVVDGRLVAAVNEERLNRLKMTIGFPRRAVTEVLDLAGVRPEQVSLVAVASEMEVNHPEPIANGGWYEDTSGVAALRNAVAGALSRPLGGFAPVRAAYRRVKSLSMGRRKASVEQLVRAAGITADITYHDHHRCHAIAAFDASGFDHALSISLDGGGDGLCCRVIECRDDGSEHEWCTLDALDSIGNFYAYVTHLCGYKASIHEGKITGLAAHGEPKHLDLLRELIDYRDGRIVNHSRLFFGSAIRTLKRRLPADWTHADLSASIQQHLEAVVVAFVQHWIERSGARRVCLSGGVFANVLLNQRIADLDDVEAIFVYPAMGDGGLGGGAAVCGWREATGTRCEPIEHVFLGRGFDDAAIEAAMSEAGTTGTRFDAIEPEIARRLADGRVVARVDGAMEYGPRALGRRTIMYRCDDASVNEWLNVRLRRTEFMPFAPACPAGEEERLFRWNPASAIAARYMTVTADCSEWMAEHCPGVVHVDGTARPQIVDEATNPSFHRVLREYEAITGVPVLINTSFNIHGEPIVCTPADAIRSFTDGHLDHLAIGSWLLTHPDLDDETGARTGVSASAAPAAPAAPAANPGER